MVKIVFTILVLTTAVAIVAMFRRVRPKLAPWVGMGIAGWLTFTALLASTGVLAHFEHFPPAILLLLAFCFVATTGFAVSSAGAWLANVIPVSWLVGFQVFRLAVELFLDWGYRIGLTPPQMTMEGRNWDVLTGLTALPVAWLIVRGKIGRLGIMMWNVAGTVLLLNIVGIAILSMPTRLRHFTADPANTFVASAPYIWLPVFLVQTAWLSHLLLFRQPSHSCPKTASTNPVKAL